MISKSISAVVGLGFLAMSSAQAATVTLTQAPHTVGIGDTTVRVLASGFDSTTETTIGASLRVDFDSAVLSFEGASLSPGSAFDVVIPDALIGDPVTDDIVEFLTFSQASGDFPVIDLHFTSLSNVSTMVSLSEDWAQNLGWLDTSAPFAEFIPNVNYESASVNPVPLPAAIWMMLGGMGLLGWTGRRRA